MGNPFNLWNLGVDLSRTTSFAFHTTLYSLKGERNTYDLKSIEFDTLFFLHIYGILSCFFIGVSTEEFISNYLNGDY